jgi:hypothetical protein
MLKYSDIGIMMLNPQAIVGGVPNQLGILDPKEV